VKVFAQLADTLLGIEQYHDIAISGLKGSGKTVFLVMLLNYLRNGYRLLPGASDPLVGDFFLQFGVYRPHELAPLPGSRMWPLFPFDTLLQQMRAGKQWPAETTKIMEYPCAITVLRQARTASLQKFHVRFIDYPGEYLGDLPLLDQSFVQWSTETLSRLATPPYHSYFKDFLAAEERGDVSFDILVSLYRKSVLSAYEDWYYFVNPIIGLSESDGQYCGLPEAEFFPTLRAAPGVREQASAHFAQYKTAQLVPFRNLLERCTRHLFLVDLFGLFQCDPRRNEWHLEDQQKLMNAVFGVIAQRETRIDWRNPFTYHRLLTNLWTEAIREIHFVASKADLFPEPHRRYLHDYLRQFLGNNLLLLESRLQRVSVSAFSACVCTRTETDTNGTPWLLLPHQHIPQTAIAYPFVQGPPPTLHEACQKRYLTEGLPLGEPSPHSGVYPHWQMHAVVEKLFNSLW
jgi:hypothetical protein